MTTNEILAHRVQQLEHECEVVQRKIDRLTWALVSLCISVTVATLVFALTTATGGAA